LLGLGFWLCLGAESLQGGNQIGDAGACSIGEGLKWAAIVVTTSAWCSLDACVAGNEESHTLHPFKAKRVCGFKLPQCKGKLNHNCRSPDRVAEDTYDTPSSVKCLTAHLHVQYFTVITIIIILLSNSRLHGLTPASYCHHTNGLLLRITPAHPRTNPPFVNMLVPRRIGKKDKPPW
jgi:hypothetical protein